jgi:hypothetical protein
MELRKNKKNLDNPRTWMHRVWSSKGLMKIAKILLMCLEKAGIVSGNLQHTIFNKILSERHNFFSIRPQN